MRQSLQGRALVSPGLIAIAIYINAMPFTAPVVAKSISRTSPSPARARTRLPSTPTPTRSAERGKRR